MKKMFLASAFAAFVLMACDKENDNNELNSTDDMFLTQVNIGNRAEIMAGQLAVTKGNSAEVRAYGQMMVNEHNLAQTDLRNVAASAGRNLRDTIDPEHQALMARLNTLSGRSFDTAYINSQVRDHQKTLNIFQMELTDGKHRAVRDYANRYMPNIQMHYLKADSLARRL
jgi:putative membrane protein